jgi:uncharacterized protein with HEPN domain
LRATDYLEHIAEACSRITQYVHSVNQATFEQSTMIQDAVIRQIEIIGEAGRQALDAPGSTTLPPVRDALIQANGMRNTLIRADFGLNIGMIWQTAHRDIPALAQAIYPILSVAADADPGAKETAYLLRDPANAQHLRDAIANLNAGRGHRRKQA